MFMSKEKFLHFQDQMVSIIIVTSCTCYESGIGYSTWYSAVKKYPWIVFLST